MAAPKHTKTQMEEVLAEVARLDRMRHNQYEIARRVGVSQPMVCVYLKTIRERYRQSESVEARESVAEAVEGLFDVMREAWEAWEQSKKDKGRKTVEHQLPYTPTRKPDGTAIPKPKGPIKLKKVKEIVVTEGQCGDNGYLKTVIECWQEICRLKAVYPAKETRVQGIITTINWDALAEGIPEEGPVPDAVEAEIAKVMMLPHKPSEGRNGDVPLQPE